jgi:hypothetical protein
MTQALHDLSRVGDYLVDIERKPPAVNYHLDILPFKLTAHE